MPCSHATARIEAAVLFGKSIESPIAIAFSMALVLPYFSFGIGIPFSIFGSCVSLMW